MGHSDIETVAPVTAADLRRPGYQNHLAPTKRGWLFLGRHGGPCDKACKMCYYAYQSDLVFFSLDTLLAHANRFRHYYGLEYADLSGGEATIYGPLKNGRRPQLERLVRHCADIGLRPTIITHGQNNLAPLVAGVEDAGLEDWLISLHGMERGHNRTVVDHRGEGAGGWQRLVANLAFPRRPVRFNTTMQDCNAAELPALATWLAEQRPPTVWNLINFNPFYAWDGKREIDFQARLSELAPLVAQAVATAEAAGWEVNVRYFPFCVAQAHGFARNCVNFYQTQYDHWEWSLAATNRLTRAGAPGGWHAANLAHCAEIGRARANAACAACRFQPICEGPSAQYQRRFGVEELRPQAGEPVTDPRWFERAGNQDII